MLPAISFPLFIDGKMLCNGGTGVSTYARALERAQAALSAESGALIASPSSCPPALAAFTALGRKAKFRPGHGGHRAQLAAPDVFRRAHIHFGLTGKLLPIFPEIPFGIMHWTYPVPLYFRGWINIYNVHDVIPITHPELSPIDPDRLRRTLRAISRVARAITTISAHSQTEISRTGIFSATLIENTGLSVEINPIDQDFSQRVLKWFDVEPQRYFIFAGSIEERKNLRRLLAAYRQAEVSMPLLIVGPSTKGGEKLEEIIRSTPGVLRLPYQPREVLDSLIASAHALIFPSLTEGFGLPVVEAMAKGTAVLTSNIPAISEVVGDAALLIDPMNVDDLVWGIRRLANDHDFALSLARAGRDRAKLYSREAFSTRLADLYSRLLCNQSGGSSPIGIP